MGLVEFAILCFVVCLIAWAAVWAIGYFIPTVPAIVPKLIWGVAVLIIVVALLRATGIMGLDPQIPRLRG